MDTESLIKLVTAQRPLIMGILNVTPDSFSDGGQVFRDGRVALDLALRRSEEMIEQGAAIIDVGGESTRPGAAAISLDEELSRVIPVVEALRSRFDVAISVDTSSPEVMHAAAGAGASMINDVRALRRPDAMCAAAATGLPVCLMHMQGEPHSMQAQAHYDDVAAEVEDFLRRRVSACEMAGIDRERIIIDPGFGFGKTLRHNLALFRHLERLVGTGLPVLVGVSRKSMIGGLLGREVGDRVYGSVALALMAAQKGAAIIRVHDVGPTADALNLWRTVERPP